MMIPVRESRQPVLVQVFLKLEQRGGIASIRSSGMRRLSQSKMKSLLFLRLHTAMHGHRGRQTDRQTDRQAGRQTDSQADRQTDRQGEGEVVCWRAWTILL